MKVQFETYSATNKRCISESKDYPDKTYKEVSNIVAKELRSKGWEEVSEFTSIFQFKILGETK